MPALLLFRPSKRQLQNLLLIAMSLIRLNVLYRSVGPTKLLADLLLEPCAANGEAVEGLEKRKPSLIQDRNIVIHILSGTGRRR